MKKILIMLFAACLLNTGTMQKAQAQDPVLAVIKAAVKKAIKALDLKIQRLQTETIWLQNAQKVIENKMSELKLKEIGDWVNRQKELYAKYYNELWKVKASISTYKRVRAIIDRQVQIVREYSTAWNLSKQDKNFSAEELDYMKQVYNGILDESMKNLEQLQLVINAFATQMSDAKRLEIIHAASEAIEQNYADLHQFNQENIRTSLQRAKDKNDVDVIKKLYGLP